MAWLLPSRQWFDFSCCSFCPRCSVYIGHIINQSAPWVFNYFLSYSLKCLLTVFREFLVIRSLKMQKIKQATYRAFNAIFGKFGRAVSAEVMIQMFNSKCFPILYYGIDICPLTNTHINLLQFVINSCYSKIFMIKSNDDIRYCQDVFGWRNFLEEIQGS